MIPFGLRTEAVEQIQVTHLPPQKCPEATVITPSLSRGGVGGCLVQSGAAQSDQSQGEFTD